ncbi:bactofilin family protein [Dysgonomonas sp.]|jgi:cytoskeletal protein CcmA (bactofilin family)
MNSKGKHGKDQPDQPPPMLTMICEGFVLHGSIDNAKAIRIEGSIIGDIKQADSVVIGKTGIVRGNINANTLIVFGYIEGNVKALESVSIKESGKIVGDLITKKLSTDQGAMYEGVTTMPTPPL